MGKTEERLKKKKKNITIIIISFITLCLGYYILDFISVKEKNSILNTLYILLGCTMIAVSGIILFVTIKKQFFKKKKRRRTKTAFLDDNNKTN